MWIDKNENICWNSTKSRIVKMVVLTNIIQEDPGIYEDQVFSFFFFLIHVLVKGIKKGFSSHQNE